MELYLTQHGRATPKEEDPDRPLSPEGREETERVARVAAAAGLRVDAIWHSGKARARQTADILAAALEPEGGVRRRQWLGPLDDPRKAVEAAREEEKTVLLVGHLPFMSRLAALLLAGNPEADVVDVRNSGIVALAETDGGGWTLRWYLRPELATA